MNVISSRDFAAAAMARALDRPDLIVQMGDLVSTMHAARDAIAERCTNVFDRGGPVRVVAPPNAPARIVRGTHNNVTEWTHEVTHPKKYDKNMELIDATLPERVSKMYLDTGDWKLRPLDGIAASPLLSEAGTIRAEHGYDPASRLWCDATLPTLTVPAEPSRSDAATALRLIRDTFGTFPYADAARTTMHDLDLVNLDHPPADAETAFIAGLMTAICRASLTLAPGLLLTAPEVTGAGSGKGLLVQAVCEIAFGSPPVAFTAGHDAAELDKRLTAELMMGGAALLLDNCNSTALRSDILASVITERPTRARIFGKTEMVPLNSTCWIAVTGNGLSVSEDLARRFLACELDPKCEDPETRDFPDGRDGFLHGIKIRRGVLLSAALTIWRWGRQNEATMTRGKPFGSFETWARWVRDPLLTLGCADPVEAIARAKARDPRRLKLTEMFQQWFEDHHDYAVPASALSEAVKGIVDPQNRGRNYIVSAVNAYVGTRAAGFVLTRQDPAGRWGHATYSLKRVDP